MLLVNWTNFLLNIAIDWRRNEWWSASGSFLIAAPSWTNPVKQSDNVQLWDSKAAIDFFIGCNVKDNACTSSKKARLLKTPNEAGERRSEWSYFI